MGAIEPTEIFSTNEEKVILLVSHVFPAGFLKFKIFKIKNEFYILIAFINIFDFI